MLIVNAKENINNSKEKFVNFVEYHLFKIVFVFLFILSIVFVWAIWLYLTCGNNKNCEFKTLFQLTMAIISIFGGGLISAIGVLYQQLQKNMNTDSVKRNDTLELQHQQLVEILLNMKSLGGEQASFEEPDVIDANLESGEQASFEKLAVFIDTNLESKGLANKITSYLRKKSSAQFLPPIGLEDHKIHVKEVLKTKLQYCSIVFIVCKCDRGNIAWVKNRIRLYERIKLTEMTEMEKEKSLTIIILRVEKGCPEFESQGNSDGGIEIINVVCSEKDLDENECKELNSTLKRLEL